MLRACSRPPSLPASPPLPAPPVLPPPSQPAEGVQRIGNSANPGTVLQGLRIENSPYIFVMKVGAHLELGLGPRGRFGGAHKVGAACWSGGRCRPSRQAWGAWGLGHCKSPAPACKVRGGACSGLRTCTHSPCEAAHIRVLRVSPTEWHAQADAAQMHPLFFPWSLAVAALFPSHMQTEQRAQMACLGPRNAYSPLTAAEAKVGAHAFSLG